MAAEIVDLTEVNDNLKLQNDGLKVQLGDRFNKEELQKYCKEKKVEFHTDESRNKRILERLNKRLTESQKCINDSRASETVIVSPKPMHATSNKKKVSLASLAFLLLSVLFLLVASSLRSGELQTPPSELRQSDAFNLDNTILPILN
jgi:hypothetical protein